MVGNVVDYGFYLIQRGEAGHMRGCYTNEYKDCGGIETIGYGTVTRPGYNNLNYTSSAIGEQQAVMLAKEEMAHKINEKCRTKFKDFDNLLPCYQAAILDTTYQGNWGAIQNAMNNKDMQSVYANITNNPNRERAAVRGRAIEMGMMIEQATQMAPDANPETLARVLADQMIAKYQSLAGSDCQMTKDELALLYRSCMAAYGVQVTDEQVNQFALSYDNVASGIAGIGSSQMADKFGNIIPRGPSYDGTIYRNGGYNGGYPSLGSRYTARARMGGYKSYSPSRFYVDPNPFQADSSKLEISRDFSSPNKGIRPCGAPQMVVIHATESPSLASTINTFQSSAEKTSAHYVIDRDGKIYQMVSENERANHAGVSSHSPLGIVGSCNDASIGIEIQRSSNEGYTQEQIASVLALTKDIQNRRGIRPENIVGHSDIAPGRKADPGADFPWDAFRKEGLVIGSRAGGDHQNTINPALNMVKADDCLYQVKPDITQIVANTKEKQESEEEKKKKEAEKVREEILIAQQIKELAQKIKEQEALAQKEAKQPTKEVSETKIEKPVLENESKQLASNTKEKSSPSKSKKKGGKSLKKKLELASKDGKPDKKTDKESVTTDEPKKEVSTLAANSEKKIEKEAPSKIETKENSPKKEERMA